MFASCDGVEALVGVSPTLAASVLDILCPRTYVFLTSVCTVHDSIRREASRRPIDISLVHSSQLLLFARRLIWSSSRSSWRTLVDSLFLSSFFFFPCRCTRACTGKPLDNSLVSRLFILSLQVLFVELKLSLSSLYCWRTFFNILFPKSSIPYRCTRACARKPFDDSEGYRLLVLLVAGIWERVESVGSDSIVLEDSVCDLLCLACYIFLSCVCTISCARKPLDDSEAYRLFGSSRCRCLGENCISWRRFSSA